MKNTGNLVVTTPSDREIAMTRVFDAPRHLVFDAFSKPELIRRWLSGPTGWEMVVCEIDLRVGGAYRFAWHGPDGSKMGMGGIYREVVIPERFVATEQFDEPWYDTDALVTTIMMEQDGRTTLTTTILYASQEIRDAVLKSPMDQGVAMGYDRLADMLATMLAQEETQAEA